MTAGAAVSRETKEIVRRRRAELHAEKIDEERQQLRGRWVTDSNALQNAEARRQEKLQRRAPRRAARANLFTKLEKTDTGLLLEEREVADRVTQDDIVAAVDLQTQQKKYELLLDKLGPYKVDFTLNGTHLLLAGLRGHVANIRWKDFALNGEVQLKDRIDDAKFLVDHTMTALAQKKYVYMYTKEGAEMHVLSQMANMDRLAYLPRHLLLCAASTRFSVMQYMDISTGQELGAKVPSVVRDPVSCMDVNPSNGVVASCDLRGVVKFWSPAVVDPLVQLKGHKGVIDDIRFHPNGRFFVTLGGDHKFKVWDCRTLRALEEYAVTYTFNTVDVSSSGLVAMGGGTNVQLWKGIFSSAKPNAPYMKFGLGYGNIAQQLRFCPFEDVLGIGHSRGFQSMLIPGAGDANPDFFYANPHETERHRKERVVSTLLDKLPPDTISLDIQVPGVNEARLAEYNENIRLNRKARAIREKKQRRADKSLADAAPTGLQVGDEEEVDEDLGYKERPATRELKTRKEKLKERKMQKWDKKDSSDKVRSKQTMRTSRIAQQRRAKLQRASRRGKDEEEDGEEEGELKRAQSQLKKRRREEAEFADDVRALRIQRQNSNAEGQDIATGSSSLKVRQNAALRRLI
ncbi:U3 small nucleolar RNA-associated protein 7 [Trypanosoma rangeli]|uniref:U3 small nucleolar RNA-associated protein 7 n=1 Tax=Trypanosoma rangeli TaxID=5698 RepID=A0A3S5IR25_TRYRA|nr:U3 small nucleolar RNA-associated protein 7 [Trypanosoma rangeli]RNF03956.1 U3 small nucleolar RNA-associated protein 7 [Trypanosoma rangeli]|eukprot:RNF03956.1 U3 small nucleolar RNA-associated protein 7 [Trypanosoma rangeli]